MTLARPLAVATAAAFTLAGCAQAPGKIAATPVDARPFASQSCTALATQADAAARSVADLSDRQTKAAREDAIAMLLIGLPTATMARKDVSKELAVAKGQVAAIDSARTGKRCR